MFFFTSRTSLIDVYDFISRFFSMTSFHRIQLQLCDLVVSTAFVMLYWCNETLNLNTLNGGIHSGQNSRVLGPVFEVEKSLNINMTDLPSHLYVQTIRKHYDPSLLNRIMILALFWCKTDLKSETFSTVALIHYCRGNSGVIPVCLRFGHLFLHSHRHIKHLGQV